MKQHLRLTAAAAALIGLAACQVSSTNQSSEATEKQAAAAKLAEVRMDSDTSYLSAEEREVVNLLIQAADLMQPIYLRQVSGDNARLRAEIEQSGDKAKLTRFDQMMGPWELPGDIEALVLFRAKTAFGTSGAITSAGLKKEFIDGYSYERFGTNDGGVTGMTDEHRATIARWTHEVMA